jgi:hypothetical protein
LLEGRQCEQSRLQGYSSIASLCPCSCSTSNKAGDRCHTGVTFERTTRILARNDKSCRAKRRDRSLQ